MGLKKRDTFLKQLLLFKDTDNVKIVTGIRRCGKSSLLDLMIEHLKENGVDPHQILKMNFESLQFSEMTYKEVYQYVLAHKAEGKRTYLFFDEPHMVNQWERTVDSLRCDIDCDIYITGSNSHMLSSEYSTLLSGRYVEINMLPLSFKEFVDFRDLAIREEISPLGGTIKRCYDKDGQPYDMNEVFESYLKYGGMPGLSELPLSEEVASRYLDSIYNTVINNDILERNVTEEKTKIADPFLLRKLVLFLADNTGKEFSYNKVTAAMNENQRLSDDENVGNHKVMSYMKGLLNAFVFYEAGRYDLRGKKLLKTNGKYYIVDLGLRNYLLGYKPYDRGFTLENLVYFELLRRGYTVNVGKVDTLEIDFRAVKGSNVQYFQITESLKDEATRNREIRPFDMIDDHYERVILTMDKGAYNINGIRVLNIVDWLLEE